jgi:hypothetical protein
VLGRPPLRNLATQAVRRRGADPEIDAAQVAEEVFVDATTGR